MSFYEDDESSGEEFMDKINVYLNKSTQNRDPSSLQGILRPQASSNTKQVTFSVDEMEAEDTRRDTSRSKEELLSKVARLTDILKESEKQVADEKDKRKKKEKNLLKLAKELKKRNSQKEYDEDRMEELDQKTKYLEHHWVLAQKELDQEKSLHARQLSESKRVITRLLEEERQKHSLQLHEQDSRITDLKKAHAAQCDELCREILKANLEADRLHGQLNNGGIRKTELFSYGDTKSNQHRMIPTMYTMAAILMMIIGMATQADLITIDTVCSPIMPGTTLKHANAGESFEPPFWAPPFWKEDAWKHVCAGSTPKTTLEWGVDGQYHRLVLRRGKKVFKKSGIQKVTSFSASRIRLWNKKGLAEDHSLWATLK